MTDKEREFIKGLLEGVLFITNIVELPTEFSVKAAVALINHHFPHIDLTSDEFTKLLDSLSQPDERAHIQALLSEAGDLCH